MIFLPEEASFFHLKTLLEYQILKWNQFKLLLLSIAGQSPMESAGLFRFGKQKFVVVEFATLGVLYSVVDCDCDCECLIS